jgi:hypothetical protein
MAVATQIESIKESAPAHPCKHSDRKRDRSTNQASTLLKGLVRSHTMMAKMRGVEISARYLSMFIPAASCIKGQAEMRWPRFWTGLIISPVCFRVVMVFVINYTGTEAIKKGSRILLLRASRNFLSLPFTTKSLSERTIKPANVSRYACWICFLRPMAPAMNTSSVASPED